MNYNQIWGELIIEELVRNKTQCFCISPGSRSTPLTLAVARNPLAKSLVFIDERAAAYFALGHARGSGKPAVLICTSGTAAANYLPAVIEASVEHIPMLVLTADRPPELQDSGADTVEANERLGFDADLRDYTVCKSMFLHFQINEIRLMTNNPLKVKALSKIGIKIIDRLPIKAGHNDYNAKYLATKAGKLGHIFSRD